MGEVLLVQLSMHPMAMPIISKAWELHFFVMLPFGELVSHSSVFRGLQWRSAGVQGAPFPSILSTCSICAVTVHQMSPTEVSTGMEPMLPILTQTYRGPLTMICTQARE